MRKLICTSAFIFTLLTAFLIFSFSSTTAATDGLILSSPGNCPPGGCAAGQRLNFLTSFSVSPNASSGPNTQVCVYTPKSGQSGSGSTPWADYTYGRLADNGGRYTEGQPESICNKPGNLEINDEWITGGYATLPTMTTEDQLEFVLHINAKTEIDGVVKTKIFQTDSSGTWQLSQTFTQTIPVAKIASTAYVAQSPADCGSNAPCFVNSGDDLMGGFGTGLRDAVLAMSQNTEIRILKEYPIKDQTVIIDKNITLSGYQDALLTYVGTTCTNPMLAINAGVTLKDLTLNDGNCGYISRNLIEIDSPVNVNIQHNTFNYGKQAIRIQDNTGNVTIAFNQIANNQDYAIYRETGAASGQVNLYANNILENRPGYQVNCSFHGTANHNYWGEGAKAVANANNCLVANEKQLGAPILLSSSGSGVEAVRKSVTNTMTYAFNGKIGVRRSAGNPYDVILVNHGQGAERNIPFYPSGTDPIQPCSNFYDVFLADDAAATDLVLALKYDLNSSCVSSIESSEYCSQTDSSKYPLWWYDPRGEITHGWDRTGQNPEGPGAAGAVGQVTTCHMAENVKEIRVTIDNSGRPGISKDINFTPFIIGLPIREGVTLAQFTAAFNINDVQLKWVTASENNVRGFHLLRSETHSGPYTRISTEIKSIGDSFIGGAYNYTDSDIDFTKTYYYKLEVINTEGRSIDLHGPISVLTSTATPTVTLTRTPTVTRTPTITLTPGPTRTSVYYYYRSPTSYYVPRTSTPSGNPTAVRTFRPSSGEATDELKPIDEENIIPEPPRGYPIDEEPLPPATGYPITEQDPELTSTIEPDGSPNTPDPQDTPDPRKATPTVIVEKDKEETPSEKSAVPWVFIFVGAFSGFGILTAVSIVLAKSYF